MSVLKRYKGGKWQKTNDGTVLRMGTIYHDEMENRDLPDQHPIEAITGLREELDNKQDAGAVGPGGTTEHNKLANRDLPDQHPIEAITGLNEALAGKQPKGNYLEKESDPTVPAWAKKATKPDYTAEEVGADAAGTAASEVSKHNTAKDSHNDIRLLIAGINDRLTAFFDSDDQTLDELSEIVAYIKNNKDLIDAVTTGKVSKTDIIDNLTTNVANKPLSAAQGVALKQLIDAIPDPPKVPAWAMQPNKPEYTAEEVGALPAGTKIPNMLSELKATVPADMVGKPDANAQALMEAIYANSMHLTEQQVGDKRENRYTLAHNVYWNGWVGFRNYEDVRVLGYGFSGNTGNFMCGDPDVPLLFRGKSYEFLVGEQYKKPAFKEDIPDSANKLSAIVPDGLPPETEANTQAILNALAKKIGEGGGPAPEPEPVVKHTVTYDLQNVKSSNSETSVENEKSYTTKLTADSSYTLGSPVITMGGSDVTSSVWNSETSTISISSVTGNVSIACTATASGGETIDTSPKIAEYGAILDQKGGVVRDEKNNTPKGCYTEIYKIISPNLIYYISDPDEITFAADGKIQTYIDGEFFTYWSPYSGGNYNKEANVNLSYGGRNADSFRITLISDYVEGCYAYDKPSGTIYFAGKNTKYYGKKNINDSAKASRAMAFDTAYMAEDLTKEKSTDGQYPGATPEWVQMVKDNYSVFATEAFGNFDRIPFIVHTDQHAQFSKSDPAYKLIGDVSDWFEISACLNLGDTCGNSFTESQLKTYFAALDGNIPYSKRVECYGNHDIWVSGPDGWIYNEPQGRLAKYLKTIYAHRYGSNGYFAVKDQYYNVKYVVINCFEYSGEFRHNRMSTQQADFLVSEFLVDDGYDIILCSHQPLESNKQMVSRDPDYFTFDEKFLYGPSNESFLQMIKARHNFTAGTFTDSDGSEHDYDFSGLKSKLLCSFHGHDHFEAYYTFPDSITEMVFDYFKPDKTFYWGYIDRKTMKLVVWKNALDAGNGRLEVQLT